MAVMWTVVSTCFHGLVVAYAVHMVVLLVLWWAPFFWSMFSPLAIRKCLINDAHEILGGPVDTRGLFGLVENILLAKSEVSLPPELVHKRKLVKEEQEKVCDRITRRRLEQLLRAGNHELASLPEQSAFHSLEGGNTDEARALRAFAKWFNEQANTFQSFSCCRADGSFDEETSQPQPTQNQALLPPLWELKVTNHTTVALDVYRCDGEHETRCGCVLPNRTLNQTVQTAPKEDKDGAHHKRPLSFVFREPSSRLALVRFAPRRAIPPTLWTPTTQQHPDGDGMELPIFSFTIQLADAEAGGFNEEQPFLCRVLDPVFPSTILPCNTNHRMALQYALLHCLRMEFGEWNTLIGYLRYIAWHPNQNHVFANESDPLFFRLVWSAPARGILLLLGFVEDQQQAVVSFRTRETPLLEETKDELWRVVKLLNKWKGNGPEKI